MAALGKKSAPFAVAVLYHPLVTYASLLLAVVAGLYAAQSRRVVPGAACVTAISLALAGWVEATPSVAGLAWLGFAVVLLHAEFLWPTFGVTAVLGVGSAAWGSSLLLAPLMSAPRLSAALVGALLLLAAVARTMRLRTLPR